MDPENPLRQQLNEAKAQLDQALEMNPDDETARERYCLFHMRECQVALAEEDGAWYGWDKPIDFSSIPVRMSDLKSHLQNVILTLEGNDFWGRLMDLLRVYGDGNRSGVDDSSFDESFMPSGLEGSEAYIG